MKNIGTHPRLLKISEHHQGRQLRDIVCADDVPVCDCEVVVFAILKRRTYEGVVRVPFRHWKTSVTIHNLREMSSDFREYLKITSERGSHYEITLLEIKLSICPVHLNQNRSAER